MKALALLLCSAVFMAATVQMLAHEETFKGKVLSVEGTRVRVNVVDPKTKKETPITFKTDGETKVLRGDKVVTFAAAKIRANENIAVTTDHDFDDTLALVIRLDAAK